MTFHSLLLPAILYGGGALLLYLMRPFTGEKTRRITGLLVTVAAFLTVIWLLPTGDILPERWTFSNWGDPEGVGRGLEFRLDTLSATYLLLTAVVGMAVFAGSLDVTDDADTPDYQPGLLALLAGLSIISLTDNLRSWLMAGLILDIGLLFSVGFAGRARWFLVLVLHSLVSQGALIFATLALARVGDTTALDPTNQEAIRWTLVAAVARLAPLPFCLFPIAFEKIPQRVLGILPLATLGIGSLLLARVTQVVEFGPGADYAGLGTIAALGVGLAGWVAWRRDEPSVRLMMITAVQSAWVLWAFSWGATDVAIRTAIFGVLALSALAVHGGRVDFRHGVQ
jgi:formate hydrogenlyase subunit 3/multisubunit Na+/H+ antiporter MnhD subunit